MEPNTPPEPVEPALPATDVDEWGLPAATTHLDQPAEPELGYSTDDDPDDPY